MVTKLFRYVRLRRSKRDEEDKRKNFSDSFLHHARCGSALRGCCSQWICLMRKRNNIGRSRKRYTRHAGINEGNVKMLCMCYRILFFKNRQHFINFCKYSHKNLAHILKSNRMYVLICAHFYYGKCMLVYFFSVKKYDHIKRSFFI